MNKLTFDVDKEFLTILKTINYLPPPLLNGFIDEACQIAIDREHNTIEVRLSCLREYAYKFTFKPNEHTWNKISAWVLKKTLQGELTYD